jgi:hypothetical protein
LNTIVSTPVSINENKDKIVINDQHAVFKKLSKKDKQVLEEILIIYKVSQYESNGDPQKFENLFFKALENWRRK